MKVERRGASYDAIVVKGGESGSEKRHQGTAVVKSVG
jgi:hypothetical protein